MKPRDRRRPPRPIYAAAGLSLVYLLSIRFLPFLPRPVRAEMAAAARLMAAATAAVKDCRAAKNIPLDRAADPNATGLIGLESSAITTSLGGLEAKRTTTNPNFAALVASLLHDAGVRRGDAVAVGASSSFPALIIAALSAVEAVGAESLVISSLGSSEWGANVPEFTWLEMEECLRDGGFIRFAPIARTVGGEEDVGQGMDPFGRSLLASRIRAGDAFFLEVPDLERNVALRMETYRKSAGARPIKAFINIGGSWANIGTNAEVLKLRPGLARRVFIPPPAERGVLQAMAARRVPVIHLLNIRGLCDRYGLPWDPRPLPSPGEGRFFRQAGARTLPGAVLTAVYILAMLLTLLPGCRQGAESPERPAKAVWSGSGPRF